MKIGIDISQIVHEGTGVATYVRRMVDTLLKIDKKNEYILFGASLRKRYVFNEFAGRAKLVVIPVPPILLSFLWNTLHIFPVEWFIGNVDVFWSSDWTQPPLRQAQGVTTIHDLIALKFPSETDSHIVATHKRRLHWVQKECTAIFCDSESTKKDIKELLQMHNVHVIYPGL